VDKVTGSTGGTTYREMSTRIAEDVVERDPG
jgi:hypothetical protein